MTMTVFTERETIIRSKAVISRRECNRAPVFSNREAPSHVPLFIPADQAYFWSSTWQRDEAESLADLEAGRARGPSTARRMRFAIS
jgi:hypothetical protein